MNLHLQFSMADHIKFQDFPGLEIKILTLQTVWLTGAEVGPLTRLLWLPLASCCEALTSHPIINEFIHSKQWSHMYWSNDPRTCWAIEAIVSSVHQVSSPGFEAMKSGAYARQLLQSSSKCEGHFFNSSQRHTSETLLSMIMHLPHLASVLSQRPVLKQRHIGLPLRL